MAYQHTNAKGQKYYLHSQNVKLRGSGRLQTIFYFAREVRGANALDALPSGFKVVENKRTGLPVLART